MLHNISACATISQLSLGYATISENAVILIFKQSFPLKSGPASCPQAGPCGTFQNLSRINPVGNRMLFAFEENFFLVFYELLLNFDRSFVIARPTVDSCGCMASLPRMQGESAVDRVGGQGRSFREGFQK